MAKLFFDVFPTLDVSGDMKKILSEMEVTKVGKMCIRDSIRGNVQGDIGCNGKLVVTGTVTGNSNSSEFFADAAKIEGEVVSLSLIHI